MYSEHRNSVREIGYLTINCFSDIIVAEIMIKEEVLIADECKRTFLRFIYR